LNIPIMSVPSKPKQFDENECGWALYSNEFLAGQVASPSTITTKREGILIIVRTSLWCNLIEIER
jgi:hypothetical protein